MFSPCSSSTYQSNARAYLLLSRFAEILTCWKRQIKIGKNDRDRHRPGQSVDIIVTNVQSKCLMWNAWLINCMRALPERLYPIFSGLRAPFLTRNARRKFITEFNPGSEIGQRKMAMRRCTLHIRCQLAQLADWLWRFIVNYRLCKRSKMLFFANANPY